MVSLGFHMIFSWLDTKMTYKHFCWKRRGMLNIVIFSLCEIPVNCYHSNMKNNYWSCNSHGNTNYYKQVIHFYVNYHVCPQIILFKYFCRMDIFKCI